jgi:hypothetical protein
MRSDSSNKQFDVVDFEGTTIHCTDCFQFILRTGKGHLGALGRFIMWCPFKLTILNYEGLGQPFRGDVPKLSIIFGEILAVMET